jgi:hypothetical protein
MVKIPYCWPFTKCIHRKYPFCSKYYRLLGTGYFVLRLTASVLAIVFTSPGMSFRKGGRFALSAQAEPIARTFFYGKSKHMYHILLVT